MRVVPRNLGRACCVQRSTAPSSAIKLSIICCRASPFRLLQRTREGLTRPSEQRSDGWASGESGVRDFARGVCAVVYPSNSWLAMGKKCVQRETDLARQPKQLQTPRKRDVAMFPCAHRAVRGAQKIASTFPQDSRCPAVR